MRVSSSTTTAKCCPGEAVRVVWKCRIERRGGASPLRWDPTEDLSGNAMDKTGIKRVKNQREKQQRIIREVLSCAPCAYGRGSGLAPPWVAPMRPWSRRAPPRERRDRSDRNESNHDIMHEKENVFS